MPSSELIIEVQVDLMPVSLALIAVPPMSISSGRPSLRPHGLMLTIDKSVLVEAFAYPYRKLVNELRGDERLYGRSDVPNYLEGARYPDIEQLIDHPNALMEVLGHYFRDEFLRANFGEGSTSTRFWIDEITGSRVGHNVQLVGICYSRFRDDAKLSAAQPFA